ncbi:immunoglobulin-like domain-containing protein [Ferruginibacter sp.]
MKSLYRLLFLFAALSLFSCKKETTKDVSQVYKVPSIALKGDDVVTVAIGAAYTDAGAKYTAEDGTVSDIQSTSSNVNTAVAGLYLVNYAVTSKSGIYQTEASRLVAVTSVNNPVDRTGTYLRAATGVNCFVKKIANGVYEVTNPGGAGVGAHTVVYFVETTLNTFVCPTQPTDAGDFAVIEINFTATGASWRVQNAGYGTGVRTFTKL